MKRSNSVPVPLNYSIENIEKFAQQIPDIGRRKQYTTSANNIIRSSMDNNQKNQKLYALQTQYTVLGDKKASFTSPTPPPKRVPSTNQSSATNIADSRDVEVKLVDIRPSSPETSRNQTNPDLRRAYSTPSSATRGIDSPLISSEQVRKGSQMSEQGNLPPVQVVASQPTAAPPASPAADKSVAAPALAAPPAQSATDKPAAAKQAVAAPSASSPSSQEKPSTNSSGTTTRKVNPAQSIAPLPGVPGSYGMGIDPYAQSMYSLTSQGQAALLNAQGALTAALDRRTLPMFLLVPLMFSLVCLFLGLIVSLYYIILLVVMVIQQSAVNAPLNIETVDYATIQSLNFFTPGQFNYMYFLLLPLATLGGIVIFTILANVLPLEVPIPRQIKGVVFVIGLSSIIMLFLQYLIYSKLGSTIKAVEKRLSFFNRYVCTKIYKNIKFLSLLEVPQASIVGTHSTMQKCLELFNENTPVNDMAQGFYTISMFYHYQKISLRNPIIFNAFDLFKPSRLLGSRCQPGAYLSRYGTYVEDITESIIRPLLPKTVVIENVENAFVLCNEWITNTNGYANTIYPEDAFSSFIIMAIITLLIQLIPMYLIIKFYQPPEEQASSKVARILNIMMEQLGISTTQQEKQLVK